MTSQVSRRHFLKGAGAAAGSIALTACGGLEQEATQKSGVVYTEQYGGAWLRAFEKHIFPPFTEKTGIKVVSAPGAGSKIARVQQMVRSGKVEIDVFATDSSDVIRGANLGLWESVTEDEVPNLAKVMDRFRKYGDKSVPNITYWMILFHLTNQISEKPSSWEVMWDPQYKGWVTAYNDPGWSNLFPITGAVLGISQEELKEAAALEKVWRKLDELKPQISQWWTSGAHFQQLVAAGNARLGEGWNGRIFDSQDKGIAIDASWPKEGGYLAIDHWTVTKGTPRRKEAMELINFLLQPENQAKIAEEIYYGPTTPRAIDLLDKKTRSRTYGPPGAMENALIEDWGWYFERPQEIQQRWDTWIAN